MILTAADPSQEAVQPAVDGIRGFIRCLPGAKEQEVLYGTGAWDKGDIYQHPVYEKPGKLEGVLANKAAGKSRITDFT